MADSPTPPTDADLPSWSIMVPEDWQLTEGEDGVEMRANEQVGLLEIAALYRDDRDFLDEDLTELAHEQLGKEAPLVPLELGDFTGFGTAFDAEDTAWRIYLLRAEKQMLFVTYHCAQGDDGKEDDTIDAILSTLCLQQPGE